MSVQDKPAAISAWIFDWDGVFVDSEMWKAWSYGLGICEVWEDFERLEASRFDRVVPAASDPFLRVCGRFVGRSREEYLEGLIEYYDLCGYDFNDWLVHVLRGWRQNAPDRIAQIEREQARAGTAEPVRRSCRATSCSSCAGPGSTKSSSGSSRSRATSAS